MTSRLRIGITYDLKSDGAADAGLPDDFQEEFDSPVTIDGIAAVLSGLGHAVEKLGDGRELLERLLADPPDFVFNFAEGHGVSRSREARVPAVLEMLGIPYTGSDPLTLAVTLDKDCARRLVRSAGLAVPAGYVVRPEEHVAQALARDDVLRQGGAAIVKPAWEGSSKGIRSKCLVHNRDELAEALEFLRRDYRQPILVEEFIRGDELTVGIVGNDPPRLVGVMRVLPNEPTEEFVYSLEVKRDFRRQVRYEVPPALPSRTVRAVEEAALQAYRVLGCRDVSRVDFRLRDGIPYFLEVNPLPGLNPESSDLVIMAGLAGWSYEQLIEAILQAALDRWKEARSTRKGASALAGAAGTH
jgi:D-alanine-D-alanine ligase